MSNSILYVNACVRKESRTERLAKKLLAKIGKPYEEICLQDTAFPAVDEEYLRKRDQGVPVGLCNASRLYYVTTAGGHYVPEEYGFGYVKALAQNYYGILGVRKIEAVGLDVSGADVNEIMRDAESAVDGLEI